ncbi:MAG TPA: hypothetical protein VGS07_28470 [Thermoanaerobaculia bacterium]|jgi:hypothetical protein|nr:hypothetical protein [Thermoanaerobaculia bacterium]
MRRRSGFLLSLLALLEGCHPAPAPSHGQPQRGLVAGDAESHLVAAKPKLMSADYRADLAELARLREELAPLADDPALGYLAHYWAGFASWRMAINGVNRRMDTQDVKAHLERAGADFEASVRQREDFADAHAAAALVYSWLAGFHPNDPAAMQEQLQKSKGLLKRARELEPNNPRVLWAVGATYLFSPPAYGGSVERAVETYRRMLEVSGATNADSPRPDWGKPEALMSLAFAYLQQSPPDVAAASEEARAALRLQPEWSYVRDVLLPQIEAAQHKAETPVR